MEKAAGSSSASNREAILANLDLPKKGGSSSGKKWSLEDDNDEDETENANGKGDQTEESEEEDPLGIVINYSIFAQFH